MTYVQAQFNLAAVSSDQQPTVLPRNDANPQTADLLSGLSDFFQALSEFMPQSSGNSCGCGTISPPNWDDRCHPRESLKVDQSSGVITTPGGYKIEQMGQFEWKITGQDGKWTRVWGDPHIQESDRSGEASAWDFKRNSTFLLPDGTRINVTTKPYNNMTVTSQLEVINGRDRVLVTDIDKGKGKVGEVTHDGFDQVDDSCGKDVFVMGNETDDWYLNGQEVVGSNDGGDSFRLGPAGNDQMRQMLRQVERFAVRLMGLLYRYSARERIPDGEQRRVCHGISEISQMFRSITRLLHLDDQLAFGRRPYQV